MPGRPWKYSEAELTPPREPALHGEHNLEICEELELSPNEISDLDANGALVAIVAAGIIANVHGGGSEESPQDVDSGEGA